MKKRETKIQANFKIRGIPNYSERDEFAVGSHVFFIPTDQSVNFKRLNHFFTALKKVRVYGPNKRVTILPQHIHKFLSIIDGRVLKIHKDLFTSKEEFLYWVEFVADGYFNIYCDIRSKKYCVYEEPKYTDYVPLEIKPNYGLDKNEFRKGGEVVLEPVDPSTPEMTVQGYYKRIDLIDIPDGRYDFGFIKEHKCKIDGNKLIIPAIYFDKIQGSEQFKISLMSGTLDEQQIIVTRKFVDYDMVQMEIKADHRLNVNEFQIGKDVVLHPVDVSLKNETVKDYLDSIDSYYVSDEKFAARHTADELKIGNHSIRVPNEHFFRDGETAYRITLYTKKYGNQVIKIQSVVFDEDRKGYIKLSIRPQAPFSINEFEVSGDAVLEADETLLSDSDIADYYNSITELIISDIEGEKIHSRDHFKIENNKMIIKGELFSSYFENIIKLKSNKYKEQIIPIKLVHLDYMDKVKLEIKERNPLNTNEFAVGAKVVLEPVNSLLSAEKVEAYYQHIESLTVLYDGVNHPLKIDDCEIDGNKLILPAGFFKADNESEYTLSLAFEADYYNQKLTVHSKKILEKIDLEIKPIDTLNTNEFKVGTKVILEPIDALIADKKVSDYYNHMESIILSYDNLNYLLEKEDYELDGNKLILPEHFFKNDVECEYSIRLESNMCPEQELILHSKIVSDAIVDFVELEIKPNNALNKNEFKIGSDVILEAVDTSCDERAYYDDIKMINIFSSEGANVLTKEKIRIEEGKLILPKEYFKSEVACEYKIYLILDEFKDQEILIHSKKVSDAIVDFVELEIKPNNALNKNEFKIGSDVILEAVDTSCDERAYYDDIKMINIFSSEGADVLTKEKIRIEEGKLILPKEYFKSEVACEYKIYLILDEFKDQEILIHSKKVSDAIVDFVELEIKPNNALNKNEFKIGSDVILEAVDTSCDERAYYDDIKMINIFSSEGANVLTKEKIRIEEGKLILPKEYFKSEGACEYKIYLILDEFKDQEIIIHSK